MKVKILWFCGICIFLALSGCSLISETGKIPENKAAANSEKIHTSVFKGAKKVDVTDLRDANGNIDLVVQTANAPGIAAQDVFSQTYDFLQQSDIQGAKTVTVGIVRNGSRIVQLTIHPNLFVAGENHIQSVLQASDIERMSLEVETYADTVNWWE
ncbi:hypothetical protein RCG23_01335 [Neobacillus sp. PS3-34]|uniref:hypothetical protein n=1 Tax=Neobacillus sp. PS3-34 TaxID=3070678 RepID=UPI0027E037E8|nr:hypothetical protein [Neobacillus sp. PS3-34]WML48806.1 hypothetical protein RCG23_01335 [Neobacillus sp. PS3-34]